MAAERDLPCNPQSHVHIRDLHRTEEKRHQNTKAAHHTRQKDNVGRNVHSKWKPVEVVDTNAIAEKMANKRARMLHANAGIRSFSVSEWDAVHKRRISEAEVPRDLRWCARNQPLLFYKCCYGEATTRSDKLRWYNYRKVGSAGALGESRYLAWRNMMSSFR
jgi:hypothetical protein